MNKNSVVCLLKALILSLVVCGLSGCSNNPSGLKYKGKPFSDVAYKAGAQHIPGKIQCEYYDIGGEGIAYHDSDSANSGSGKLNPADGSYLNEFRKDEPVDISYTKFRDPGIDNNPYNIVEPEKDQLYVGWTNPGEWIKFTVIVESSGLYKFGLMFTSNRGGKISISVNDKDVTGPVSVPSTFNASDTIAWRQWHHWNYIDSIGSINLTEGRQVLTLHTLENGQMNYDFLNFQKVK